jgi:hypothetical protein
METQDLIKQAVSFVNEDTRYYKNVFASTPPDPEWFIYQFTLEDSTPERKQIDIVTAPTQRNIDNYSVLLRYFGWKVFNPIVKKHNSKIEELYRFVDDKAWTEKTIPPAPGSKEICYVVNITWEKVEDASEQSKTFITVPSRFSRDAVKKLFKEDLEDPISAVSPADKVIMNLKVDIQPAKDSMRQGTLDFNTISPAILTTESKLSAPVAYKITYTDYEGEDYEIITERSTTPIEEYVKKLKMSGFTNIEFDVSRRPGNIGIDNIDSNTKPKPKKPNSFFQKIKDAWNG